MNAEHGPFFTRRPHPAPVAANERASMLEDPGFGRVFTDHMATIRWTQERGWCDAEMRAREPFVLDPAARRAALCAGDLRGPQGLSSERWRRRAVPSRAERAPFPGVGRAAGDARAARRRRSCARSRNW